MESGRKIKMVRKEKKIKEEKGKMGNEKGRLFNYYKKGKDRIGYC